MNADEIDEQVQGAMHAYYNDPVLHARAYQAVQVMSLHKESQTGERMSPEEEATARMGAALALYLVGPDRMYQRVGEVMRLTGEEYATKSRDFGRGYAHALEVVREHLSGLHDKPEPMTKNELAMLRLAERRGVIPPMPRRLIDICLIPGCGCDGNPHP